MNQPQSTSAPNRKSFLICAGLLALILFVLFFKTCRPGYVAYSNDCPYGGMVATQNRLPAILTGMWQDLDWLGGAVPAPAPNVTTALRLVTSPLVCSKIFPAFALFFLGLCACICFRLHKFSPLACLLVAVAAALNSDFFDTACWGVCAQPVAFGMNFLALGALADTTSPRRWLRVALAGFAVGLGVSEAYDIGALFSLVVAAFVVVQSFVSDGPVVKRIANGAGRLLVVALCAAFISAAALQTLVGTQIKGVLGSGQDAQTRATRWNEATQWSLPKVEALGILVPGLFGFCVDTPEGGAYWGRAGSDPSWDEFIKSGGQRGKPSGPFRFGDGSTYAGVFVILLAAFGVAQSFRKNGAVFTAAERKLSWFWCAVLVAALLLMVGRFAPFYRIFYCLPYASLIRNPAKFLHVAEWALLILFAYGAEALCRVGFTAADASRGGNAPAKSIWTKASAFDRIWLIGSALALLAATLAWLAFASAKGRLAEHLLELSRLQALATGAAPDASATDAAWATARRSVSQAGRTMLFLVPAVVLVALTMRGYFRERRVRVGGVLLFAMLLADLFPVSRQWVGAVNWKERYESNSVIELLRARPYEHRATRFAVEDVMGLTNLPPAVVQQHQLLEDVYVHEWMQHLFPYNNIQSFDVIQEPRLAADKAAYESVAALAPVRGWELSNTRYVLAPASLLETINSRFDARKNRFRLATRFDLVAKPDISRPRLDQFTTFTRTNGQWAVIDFAGALPRAKLYAHWKVSTNGPAQLQAWVKNIQPRLEPESASALAAQSPTDLATLQKLADPSFDPAQTVLLAEPLPVAPGTNQNVGDVKFESYAPKHVTLAATAAAPCVLLLNDRYDPNWHVSVDGQPANLLRCNFIARGVFLDRAGEHRVEFRFHPPLTGLCVSLAALVVGLGLLGYVVFARR